MATVTLKYLGGLKTECVHTQSGATLATEAPVDNGGQGTCFSPTDLCATALMSCAVTIMGKTAEAHNINVTGMHATVDKVMSASPRRIGELVVHVYVPQTLTEKEQTLLKRAAHTCPVHLTLHPDVKQEFVFHFGA